MTFPTDSSTVASGATHRGGRDAPSSGWVPVSGFMGATGDSLSDETYALFPAKYMQARTGFPREILVNEARQAETMAQIVDRIPAMLARYPMIQCWENRFGTNGPGSNTYQFQFQRAFEYYASAGKQAIFHQIPPRRGDSTFQAENAWLKAACAAQPAMLAYIEDCTTLGDSNFVIKEQYFVDGIHFTPSEGVDQVVEQGAPLLAPYLAAIDPAVTDPTDKYPSTANFVQNTTMAGAGGLKDGAVTGGVADGWKIEAFTTASYSASKVAAAVGQANQTPWQRTTIASCSAAVQGIAIRTSLVHPTILADMSQYDYFDIIAQVRCVDLNADAVASAVLTLDVGNQYKGVSEKMPMPGTGIVNKTSTMRISFVRNRGPYAADITPEGYAANSLNVGLWIALKTFSGAGGSIDIRCVSVRGKKLQ